MHLAHAVLDGEPDETSNDYIKRICDGLNLEQGLSLTVILLREDGKMLRLCNRLRIQEFYHVPEILHLDELIINCNPSNRCWDHVLRHFPSPKTDLILDLTLQKVRWWDDEIVADFAKFGIRARLSYDGREYRSPGGGGAPHAARAMMEYWQTCCLWI